jgi:hypothetical protein
MSAFGGKADMALLPATLPLFAAGVGGLGLLVRRVRKKRGRQSFTQHWVN